MGRADAGAAYRSIKRFPGDPRKVVKGTVVKETSVKHVMHELSSAKSRVPYALTLFALSLSGLFTAQRPATAQNSPAAKIAPNSASLSAARDQKGQSQSFSRAYVDYLLAWKLADDGSKPESLQMLAESLRLQPQHNPASGLAFELLTEQRTNSRLMLRGHAGPVLYAAYSPDGTKIVTTSADHTARLWDARTGSQLTAPLQHDDAVLVADFSPDGKRVVTGSEDHTARLWDVANGRPVGVPMRGTGAIQCVKFSPDGKIVATGSDDGKARTWDAETGQPILPVIVYHEAVYSVSFSPDSSRLLSATGDGVADLLDPKTGAKLLKPLRQNNIIFTAVFSPDGRTVLTASADHTAKTWNAKTGQPLGPIFHHGFSVDSAVFNQDASRVVTTSWDHTARVWDARTGQPVTPPLQHSEAVLKAIFSPDGNLVATASRDHTARLWDANSGEQLRLPVRAPSGVNAVAFSPSGASLLIACNDATVQVFDTPPHDEPPSWVADLAEFAATQTKYNQQQQPDLTNIRLLRTQLLASRSNDLWSTFGRWYFSESDARPISPWSTISLQQYVESLIALGDKDSLDYASTLSYDHPAWMAKIVKARAGSASTAHF
jgi:WD40 repeat protein